ncbi:hypothetical protein BGZ76_007277, partial [Entomortierella beljakovae]
PRVEVEIHANREVSEAKSNKIIDETEKKRQEAKIAAQRLKYMERTNQYQMQLTQRMMWMMEQQYQSRIHWQASPAFLFMQPLPLPPIPVFYPSTQPFTLYPNTSYYQPILPRPSVPVPASTSAPALYYGSTPVPAHCYGQVPGESLPVAPPSTAPILILGSHHNLGQSNAPPQLKAATPISEIPIPSDFNNQ